MGFSSNKNSQQQTSSSTNQAYPLLADSLGGQLGNVGASSSALSSLLGGDASGFNAFKGATGFDATEKEGIKNVIGGMSGNGTAMSGATLKGVQNYGQTLQNQTAQSYIQNLLGLGNLGIGAGGILAGAGGTSQGSGSGSGKGLGLQLKN